MPRYGRSLSATTISATAGRQARTVRALSVTIPLLFRFNLIIAENQKFNVDGQMLDAFAVRKGMIITATKITDQPAVEITKSKAVTGEAAPTSPTADVPVLAAVGSEEAVPAPAAETTTRPAATTEVPVAFQPG